MAKRAFRGGPGDPAFLVGRSGSHFFGDQISTSIFDRFFIAFKLQNWSKMNSFLALLGSKIDEKSESIFRPRKIHPRTNNYRILDPSDPQNHQKTTVKQSKTEKSHFSLRAPLRTEKTPKKSPKRAQNGAQNGQKTVKKRCRKKQWFFIEKIAPNERKSLPK